MTEQFEIDFLSRRWRAQENDMIGGWCLTLEADPRTPAQGAVPVADFCRQSHAEHIAELHNKSLEES